MSTATFDAEGKLYRMIVRALGNRTYFLIVLVIIAKLLMNRDKTPHLARFICLQADDINKNR